MIYDMNQPAKPPAPDLYTQSRWDESSLRHRMLTGNWGDDLAKEMERHFNSARREIIGIEDMSSNVFKGVCQALNSLYNLPPMVGVWEGDTSAEELLGSNGLINQGGLWAIMQRVLLLNIGLREMFVRVDIHNKGLSYIPVTPDMIYAESHPSSPMEPTLISELKLRKHNGKLNWFYDIYDIRDPKNPRFEIREAKKDGTIGEDYTDSYLEKKRSGKAYPYKDKTGKPFLPFACYHAQLIGDRLFDPFTNAELVAGSLVSAAIHTYLLHIAKNAAFPQRYVMGCGLDGLTLSGNDSTARRQTITTDPTSILVFSPDSEMQGLGQPIIGQWSNVGDPKALMEVIVTYERKLAQNSGINPASVQKVSGDPRSGYAIAMSRSDQRDAQRRFKPSMMMGDIQTLEISAKMANRFLKKNFPETGYKIEYQTIPQSKDELEAIRKDTIEKAAAGYLTKTDALRVFFPDLSDDQAYQYLREVKRQQIEFNTTI